MLKLVILFSVITTSILLIYEVECNSRRELDIEDILDLLQLRNHNYLRQKSDDDVTSDGSSLDELRVRDDEDNSRYGSLTNEEIIERIQQATRDTNKYKGYNRNSKYKSYGNTYGQTQQKRLGKNSYQYMEKRQPSNYENHPNLERLFSNYEIEIPSSQSGRYKESQYPNKITNDIVDNLDDYSKVYIILNPLAIEKSKSKESLSDMITKVMSLSNRNEREHKRKKQDYYYKGLPRISDLLSRRSKRDSRESFDPKDSMEEITNYKQKHSRNDYGGGGGSGGGRTAIPYIRQRGDIYERDN